ncbi:hypothetical protein J6590_046148 [Homalodisca vitripennis]|nr:hypothetical protein J6590_046148 [Homalodisca vitripennis]
MGGSRCKYYGGKYLPEGHVHITQWVVYSNCWYGSDVCCERLPPKISHHGEKDYITPLGKPLHVSPHREPPCMLAQRNDFYLRQLIKITNTSKSFFSTLGNFGEVKEAEFVPLAEYVGEHLDTIVVDVDGKGVREVIASYPHAASHVFEKCGG